MSNQTDDYLREINTVSTVTLIGNVLLSGAKFVTGIFAASAALVSDAVHSLSDCFSTVIVLIGARAGTKKSDTDHPYGHERLECVAALILSAMLLATAILIAYEGVTNILDIVNGANPPKPEILAPVVAGISVLVKGWMYIYTERKAKKLRSTALHGDAVHHLSDSLSSIGAIIGIVGAMLGFAALDSVAALIIAGFIVKAAWDICSQAIGEMIDQAADEQSVADIEKIIKNTEGVERIDVLRTRKYANKIFVDVEIAVDSSLSLLQAHKIAEEVHCNVEHGNVEGVKHCMVHVNPLTGENNHESPQEEME